MGESMPSLRRKWVRGTRVSLFALVVLVGFVSSAQAARQPGSKPLSGRASPSELAARRKVLHAILDRAKNQEDNIHDTCGELQDIGDASSVPYLIRVLKLFPDVEIEGKPGLGI